MKVALGAAKGLAYLHSPEARVIYRDFKSSNILLDSVWLVMWSLVQSNTIHHPIFLQNLVHYCSELQRKAFWFRLGQGWPHGRKKPRIYEGYGYLRLCSSGIHGNRYIYVACFNIDWILLLLHNTMRFHTCFPKWINVEDQMPCNWVSVDLSWLLTVWVLAYFVSKGGLVSLVRIIIRAIVSYK